MCLIVMEGEDGPVFQKVSCSQRPAACAMRNIGCMLRKAGLRPTRQRMDLGRLLFSGGDRHVTAESLHTEALDSGVDVSLATVYNTLHQFTQSGLLRQIAADGAKTFFDTNLSDHHHFFVEGEDEPRDIASGVRVGELPEPPEGMEVVRVEVVVHLRRRERAR